jgi:Ca2+-binding RTX toxin-like protein
LRRASSIFLAAAFLLCAFADSAGSQGQIVLHGAGSGSHLLLRVDGSRLEVTGHLAHRGNVGCRIVRGGAICRLTGVGMVVVKLGAADDKVEVLDKLPVPLTAYLGAGSDKLIGNAEADTCYPQQTPRNRCIGGAGRDVCISGPVNTDCVGEGGDDFCQTRGGSDGCWGGPGNDTCVMGKGEDGCHGEEGNDQLYGGGGADRLYGGPGFDRCDGGSQRGRSAECETGLRH